MAGGALKFKGESSSLKKQKKKAKAAERPARAPEQDDELTQEVDGWLPVPSAGIALGPVYLTRRSTDLTPPLCVAMQPTTGKVIAQPLPPRASLASSSDLQHLDAEELEALAAADGSSGEVDGTPSDVHHVWVCTRVQDSDDKITLRAANGKFLAADRLGFVSADREARGALEEWTIQPARDDGARPGAFALQSSYGRYLSADAVAGGKVELRADEEERSEGERWTIWMQAEFIRKARAQQSERGGSLIKRSKPEKDDGLTVVQDYEAFERDSIMKHQARGGGRFVGADAIGKSKRELKRAREQGNLNETMLDRRVKLKSDRYC